MHRAGVRVQFYLMGGPRLSSWPIQFRFNKTNRDWYGSEHLVTSTVVLQEHSCQSTDVTNAIPAGRFPCGRIGAVSVDQGWGFASNWNEKLTGASGALKVCKSFYHVHPTTLSRGDDNRTKFQIRRCARTTRVGLMSIEYYL